MKTGEPLPVGHLLDGRYRIHQLLGAGGMGRVYLANDTRLANRPVAVKEMILGDGVQELKAIEDFQREASVLARLSHPSIPQIIDYFGEQRRHYLVMEYVAGGDLQHRLDQMGAGARMGEAEVLSMACQLLEVLQFLHSQKPPIIYRDLKPANIMIDHHGRAMLIDFGIARFLPPGGRGTQIGSVGYAPPEQYLGKMEPRSDLYALAATMHHLLTGRDPQLQPPFSFPSISALAPEVSAHSAQVIMAALDQNVAHRPASALAMRDQLRQPPSGQKRANSPATDADQTAKPSTSATAVLARPSVSSNSRTPRSLPTPSIPASIAPSRSIPPSSSQAFERLTVPPQVRAAGPAKSSPADTPPGLRRSSGGDAASRLSTSRTADLGLKKAHKSALDARPNPSREPKARSRVAAALASVRSVMAAAPMTTTKAATPSFDRPAVPARLATPLSFANPPASPGNLNGGHGYAQPALPGARLVSPTEGVQFGMFGSRLVLGRAVANGDRVDIDLSNLRRGTERISRRHAEIIKQGNDYFVRDLGSANGTYIAGRGRLGRDQLYKLKDRDQLVLGGAKLEFRRS